MLLEKEITNYSSEDGLLYINCNPYVNVILKYAPWEKGMSIQRFDCSRWVNEYDDPDIPLITLLHQTTEDLPVNHYIRNIPLPVQTALLKIEYLQTSVLQLVAKSNNAFEMLFHSPVLLWMIAAHLKKRSWSVDNIDKMIRKKRTDILSELVGINSQSGVKFIKKIQILNGDSIELTLISNSVIDERIIYAFRCWKRIPTHILSILKRFPELVDAQFLNYLGEIENSHSFDALTCACKTMEIWRDVLRLGQRLNISRNHIFNLLNKCKTDRDIKNLHDQWIYRTNKLNVCLEKGENLFPSPPVKGNEYIIPILTEEDLMAEGKIMHHCVGSYAPEVIAGQSYMYRVLFPERATLEIKCDNKGIRIGQFKLANNERPAGVSWEAVNRWLENHKNPSLLVFPNLTVSG